MGPKDKYEAARERVEKQKNFYRHLVSWLGTSAFLMVLFLFLRMPPWITMVVIAGWGIAIATEAVDVFGLPGMDRDWEERKIQEELERMERWEEPEEDFLDLNERQSEKAENKKPPRGWRDSDLV